jgi:hypothetical protein
MALSPHEADRIATAGLPVLCIDTCSLLDIIRDPYRDTSLPHNAVSALALLQMMESGTSVVSLLADQVRLELATHMQGIVDEAIRGLGKLREHIERVDGLVSAFSPPVQTDIRHWDTHVAKATEVLQRWIGASVVAPQSPDVPMRAYSRVMHARAPARKGKDSLADCVILETYIEAATELRRRGMTTPIVLLSSNVQDYAAPPGRSMLHLDLQSEFDRIGMAYATGYGMAKSFLGLT